jgi:hypothetical protein
MLAEVLIESLRGHWGQWCERALVVMVAVFCDFNNRWKGVWVVDVCLLGTQLGTQLGSEVDVVDVAWSVEECGEILAPDRVVLGAYVYCDGQSQY